jgi:hypothetical protein
LKNNLAIRDTSSSPAETLVKAGAPASACKVLPPPCASGFHTDSNGDCVSDVSVPQKTTQGK